MDAFNKHGAMMSFLGISLWNKYKYKYKYIKEKCGSSQQHKTSQDHNEAIITFFFFRKFNQWKEIYIYFVKINIASNKR